MDKSIVFKESLDASIQLKQSLRDNDALISTCEAITQAIIDCYDKGGKVLFCGNGGSAADAQHLAAELSGRYYYDRPPLASEALHVNTSYLTAVANDYSYDEVYARLIRGIGKPGDVLIGLSTSGNSRNVIQGIHAARELRMTTVGMSGETGGKMRDICDHIVMIPSKDTPRIQECHMLLGHSMCQIVESVLFPR